MPCSTSGGWRLRPAEAGASGAGRRRPLRRRADASFAPRDEPVATAGASRARRKAPWPPPARPERSRRPRGRRPARPEHPRRPRGRRRRVPSIPEGPSAAGRRLLRRCRLHGHRAAPERRRATPRQPRRLNAAARGGILRLGAGAPENNLPPRRRMLSASGHAAPPLARSGPASIPAPLRIPFRSDRSTSSPAAAGHAPRGARPRRHSRVKEDCAG